MAPADRFSVDVDELVALARAARDALASARLVHDDALVVWSIERGSLDGVWADVRRSWGRGLELMLADLEACADELSSTAGAYQACDDAAASRLAVLSRPESGHRVPGR